MSDKRTSFNKNASPFFPAGLPLLLPALLPYGVANLEAGAPSVDVEVSNVPSSASQANLEKFLASLVPESDYKVVHFALGLAVVRFGSPTAAHSAAAFLNSKVWLDSELQVAVVGQTTALLLSQTLVGSDDLPSTPSPLEQYVPPQLSGPANPYYYMPPFGYPVGVEYGYFGPNPPPLVPINQYGYYGASPVNTRNSSRRNSARHISRNNSLGGSYKPPPPFLLNMVRLQDSRLGESSPPRRSSDFTDLELISIADEEGNPIKVNPRRLFVGNIPFNSTWPALKNFLITRAEEIEPGNSIEILRVEIPMQQPRDSTPDSAKLNSYHFLTLLSQQLQDKSGSSTPEIARVNTGPGPGAGSTRGMSRGFAIVTTGNKQSLDKIIKYFDNVEFEGRILTVRFDRFPDFNNYVLQQLYPSSRNGLGSKPAFLSNLAFERNSFQQKFYYGNTPIMPYNFQRPGPAPRAPAEFSVNELAGPLGDIERTATAIDPESAQTRSDEETARELVNSFVHQDLSAQN